MHIRSATAKDQQQVWHIINAVIQSGDTYVFSPDSSREKMLACWFNPAKYTYVAEENGKIAGTFFIQSNQPDLGSHIANAGFMVSPGARGKGTGKLMGEYAIKEAKNLGYQAMQFNIVVKSNEIAVKLWQELGFRIIGEIPEAFQHTQLGLTNAYIMYRKL